MQIGASIIFSAAVSPLSVPFTREIYDQLPFGNLTKQEKTLIDKGDDADEVEVRYAFYQSGQFSTKSAMNLQKFSSLLIFSATTASSSINKSIHQWRCRILAAFSSTAVSRRQITSPDPMVQFLQCKVNFSADEMSVLQRRYPRLFKAKCTQRAEEAIDLFRSYGLSDAQLRHYLLRNSAILFLRAEQTVRPRLQLLKSLGFPSDAFPEIISKGSRVLNTKDITARIARLEAVCGGTPQLRKLVIKHPQALAFGPKKVERHHNLLKNLGMQNDAIFSLVFRFPHVLSVCSPRLRSATDYLKKAGVGVTSAAFARGLGSMARSRNSFRETEKALAASGLGDEEIRHITRTQPHLLASCPETLRRKMDFLVHSVGVSVEAVAKKPVLLGLSVNRRIKPRVEIFRRLSATEPSVKLPSLSTFFMVGEHVFRNRYVKSHPDAAKLLEILQRAQQQAQ